MSDTEAIPPCKRHFWAPPQIRRLAREHRRGQQVANAELINRCATCGKIKRVTYLNVRPQTRGAP